MPNESALPPIAQAAAREASHVTEASFRQLVEGVADYAILLLDAAGAVQSWNRGAVRMFAYEASEILGRPYSILHAEHALAEGWANKMLEIACTDGRVEDETWCVRRDGTMFLAGAVVTVMRDDAATVIGYSTILRDITRYQEFEEAARQSDVNFRLLVEEVKDCAIFMLTPEGLVASWNAGAENIKGYHAGEIIGKHIACFYEADAVARKWPDHELELARANGRYEDEGWRRRKDGTRFWANVSITALRDADGALRGFAKVTRDLTTRRQVEELRRTERRTNEFLAMLAHELRNPLSPMRTALDLTQRTPDSPTVSAFALDVFSRQLTHLTRLVDDLLDVSRITRGKIALKLDECNLNQVLHDAGESMRLLIEARGQTLVVRLPDAPTMVNADATRMAQVVSNLLSNAMKYTPAGGRISLTLTRTGDMATMRVRDTGVGMSGHLLPRIFDLFVQGERGLDRREGGLGIGLTLVKRLVEMHHGTVAATSEGPGKGSDIAVRLPVVERETPREVVPTPVMEVLASLKVLVVDDKADVASSMEMLLTMMGHVVSTAADGVSALSIAETLRPDVVLLDIGLPRMNGYDVARALRATPAGADAMLVACTGYGRDEARQLAAEAGFDRHVVKPIGADKLREILSAAARRHDAN